MLAAKIRFGGNQQHRDTNGVTQRVFGLLGQSVARRTQMELLQERQMVQFDIHHGRKGLQAAANVRVTPEGAGHLNSGER